jgi:hypothetical protein
MTQAHDRTLHSHSTTCVGCCRVRRANLALTTASALAPLDESERINTQLSPAATGAASPDQCPLVVDLGWLHWLSEADFRTHCQCQGVDYRYLPLDPTLPPVVMVHLAAVPPGMPRWRLEALHRSRIARGPVTVKGLYNAQAPGANAAPTLRRFSKNHFGCLSQPPLRGSQSEPWASRG